MEQRRVVLHPIVYVRARKRRLPVTHRPGVVRVAEGVGGGQLPAKVVAQHEGRFGQSQVGEEQEVDVFGHRPLVVAAPRQFLDPWVARGAVVAAWTGRVARAAIVGGDDPVPGVGEQRDHVPPLPRGLGPTVQQDERVRPRACGVVMHPHSRLQERRTGHVAEAHRSAPPKKSR